MILSLIKISIKNLFKNKTRTVLTILGIYIGVVSIILIATLSESIKDKVKNELNNIEELIITSKITSINDINYKTSKEIKNKLEKEKSIKSTAVKMCIQWREYSEKIENYNDYEEESNEDYSSIICAIDTNYFEMYDKFKENIIKGRNFSKLEEDNCLPVCIIREDLAMEIFNKNNCIGEKITINNCKFKVVGVIRQNDITYGSENTEKIYILESFVQDSNEKFEIEEMNYIIEPLSMNSRQEAYFVANKIFSEYLSEEKYSLEQYIYSAEDVAINIINIITIIILLISGISVVSGGIGIINVLLISVNERIKEIGIRRALGTTKKMIFLQYIIEGIIITLMAGILGIITSICIIKSGNLVFYEYKLDLYINSTIMIKTLLLCGFIGIIFSIYPAYKASKLNPAEALKC